MQIPILNGIYADENANFRTVYPRNMVPVPKQQGISNGYLRPADGLVKFGDLPGTDRGGINWSGAYYRVAGTKLVKVNIDGSYIELGDVGGSGQVSMDYSFDRLAIASSNNFFYWDGVALTQVTDADLGNVIDFIWVDSYFLTTDGTYLVVTELADPTDVNPLKYGSSETDPDPIMGVVKVHDEPYAINRYTIEAFENVGGSYFPYKVITGALINKGAIGTHAKTVFKNAIAFVGSGRNEPPAVWLGLNAQAVKLSTREIDQILKTYSEYELSQIVVEARIDDNHNLLYIHLHDQTLVYDANGSEAVGEPVWFFLDSGVSTPEAYKARNFVWCYDKWLFGDPTSAQSGELINSSSKHFGLNVGWEFGTNILYNEGRGAIIHSLELVALPGRVPLGADPTIWTSYSTDGETWSIERSISAGKQGERNKRLVWLQQGAMNHWRLQRFRGDSNAHLSIARLEGELEALNV